MSLLRRLALATLVVSVLVAVRGRLARLVRTIDQRAGIFAPHGAALYDAVAPSLLRPLFRRVVDDLAVALANQHGAAATVLEIGSGPGVLALEIATRLPEAQVVGADLAEAMVERATERAGRDGVLGRVRFELADAAALPLPDASVDAVISTLSLHHWAYPAAVFAEIGRVLRPGGVALIYDLRPFEYRAEELAAFVGGSPFDPRNPERELVRLGPLPAVFVRLRLVRATDPGP